MILQGCKEILTLHANRRKFRDFFDRVTAGHCM